MKKDLEMRSVTVPNTFWDDHAERCCEQTGLDWKEVKRTKRETTVLLGGDAFENLLGDAEYYASPNGPDECPGLKASAKATLRRLKAAEEVAR